MTEKFRIGLYTSAWDEVAWELVREIYQNVESGVIPNSEIVFVFCSREEGETNYGDFMIKNVRKVKLPLITFSSLGFKPELREKGKRAEKKGHPTLLNTWRSEKTLAEGKIKIRIENSQIIDQQGYILEGGYDLTKEIESILSSRPGYSECVL